MKDYPIKTAPGWPFWTDCRARFGPIDLTHGVRIRVVTACSMEALPGVLREEAKSLPAVTAGTGEKQRERTLDTDYGLLEVRAPRGRWRMQATRGRVEAFARACRPK